MPYDAIRRFRQYFRQGCLQGVARVPAILFPAEIADHIHHAHFPHAPAGADITLGDADRAAVVAGPDAEVGLTGAAEGKDGVADGGGDRKGAQRRLPEAKVGHSLG